MNGDKQIVIIGLCVLGVILVLFILIKALAEVYINSRREELIERIPSAPKCIETAEKLLTYFGNFCHHINALHLAGVYSCSSSVVAGAANNPIKYLIKYSNIENNVETLQMIDFCIMYTQQLNQFTNYLDSVSTEASRIIPIWVKLGAGKTKFPYKVCGIDYKSINTNYPLFRFSYISPAGKSGRTYTIVITDAVLMEIRNSLNSKIQKSGYSKAQRSAMSNDLREAIKKRDNYTCCMCGNSVLREPNLLLEVDHIIPIAKGGRTEASNLQTLCWRCNREKSDKML